MIENYTVNKFFHQLAKELLGENATQQQIDDYVTDLKNKFENFQQHLKNKEKNEFEPYKEEARKILAEYNIQTTEDELETFAAFFCANSRMELLTKYQQQQTNHINELIDKLDNEYKGNINEIVENSKYNNNNTNIDHNFAENFPLKTDSIYINEEDLSIIYVKSVCPSKTTEEVEVLMDTYIFNDEGNYILYKNQYHNFDFSKFCKQYTTEKLTLYREISKEQTTNIINNIKMLQDNIKTMQDNMKNYIKEIEGIINGNLNEIKQQLKNLIKNAVLINEIV
jgi:predicted transcriptional regulator